MTIDLKTILKDHLVADISGNKLPVKQLPIDAVDRIADSLVSEYVNPEWRKWYCGVIYEFGPAQVEEWRKRADDGKVPAKLFTTYVTQARKYKRSRP